jgi:hypothetical protein
LNRTGGAKAPRSAQGIAVIIAAIAEHGGVVPVTCGARDEI